MKLKNICLGLACMAALASCSDQLDYKEYTSYSKEYVFTDFNRTAAFVTNIYSYLDYDFPGSNSYCSAADESEYAWSWSSVNDFFNGAWGPTNPHSQWGFYTPIRAANYYLEESKNADFSELVNDKDYAMYMARFNRHQYEVRFLRAYFYFFLARAYGDIPFTTQVLTDNEANRVPRTPASDVFDFVVSECDQIVNELPVSYSNVSGGTFDGNLESGRVTRGAVLALKARTLLYQASPLFNTSGNLSLWQKAAQASKAVIDYCATNGIALGNYSALWGTDNWQAAEMIFVRRVGNTNTPEVINFPIGMENANSGNCPTQTLVDAYEMKTTGKAWNEDGSGYDAQKPYSNRDPRLALTVAVNGEKWPDTNPNPLETYIGGRNGLPISGATPTGYYLKKYLDRTIDLSSASGSGGKRHSWITYRLGEFYLNYAEAVFNYLGSADATNAEFAMSAREAVNKVRDRADVKMPGFPVGLSNSDFTTKYQRERMVELAFEGHRFWDVRRWKIGNQLKSIVEMKITKNGDTYTYTRVTKNRVWEDKMYLFPIPATELRKNSNLTQNPDW